MLLLFLLCCSKKYQLRVYIYAPLVRGESHIPQMVRRVDSLNLTGNAEGIPPPLRGPPPFDKGGRLFVNFGFKNADIRKMTVLLVIVKTVTYNKFIRNCEAEIIRMDIGNSAFRFIKKGCDSD